MRILVAEVECLQFSTETVNGSSHLRTEVGSLIQATGLQAGKLPGLPPNPNQGQM